MIRTVIVVILSAALAACSMNEPKDRSKRNQQALSTQQMLAESGFVESMLDMALCGCMYSGDASANERYNLRLGRQAAQSNNFQAQQIQSGNQKVIRPIGRYD